MLVPASLPVVRFEVSFTETSLALMAEQIPTVERTGSHTIAFVGDDYLKGYRFVRVLYKNIQKSPPIGPGTALPNGERSLQ